MKYIILMLIVSLMYISLASAHGLATLKTSLADGYLMNFEYDTLGNVPAEKIMYYRFELMDEAGKEFIPFDKVFVKFITKSDNKTVFVADLLESEVLAEGARGARLNTELYKPGDYSVQAVYFKDKKQVAGTLFDFKVDPAVDAQSKKQNQYTNYLWIITLVVGLVVGFGLRGKFPKKNENI